MKRDVDYDNYDKLAQKYGMSREQAIESCNNMKKQAQTVGLDFHFDTMVVTNTFDAHRLTLLAAKHGKMLEMSERLFHAFFTESKHIGDHKTLIELAAEVGLDPIEVTCMLETDDFEKEVRADEQDAMNLDVRGVPFYVFDRKYAISGAQPSEVFLKVLEKVWQEDYALTTLSPEGEVCDVDGCHIPDKKD
jgi:predicted DsbA family dithiol-disulfide isomerase